VDEGEGGKPVIQKWEIKRHVKYVKAEGVEIEIDSINEMRLPTEAEFNQIATDVAAKKLKREATKQAVTQAGMKAITAIGSRTLLRTSIKMLGKETTRVLLKSVPVVGLALGAVFAANRLAKGEYVKASVELVGGVASTFPGIGTAVALACDAALVTGDVQKVFAMKKDFKQVESGTMSQEDFKKKYNLEKLKNESVDTERWNEIDSAVNQLINEYSEIDSAIEDTISEMVEEGEYVEQPLWKNIVEGAAEDASALAKQIVDEAKKRKVKISVDSSTSVSFSKEFAAGNRDAFFDALRDCTTIRSMVRFKKRVNEWGASLSGSALGAQSDLKAGRVTIHKSGDGAAYLLKALDKMT
jgi:hypothetical protein